VVNSITSPEFLIIGLSSLTSWQEVVHAEMVPYMTATNPYQYLCCVFMNPRTSLCCQWHTHSVDMLSSKTRSAFNTQLP